MPFVLYFLTLLGKELIAALSVLSNMRSISRSGILSYASSVQMQLLQCGNSFFAGFPVGFVVPPLDSVEYVVLLVMVSSSDASGKDEHERAHGSESAPLVHAVVVSMRRLAGCVQSLAITAQLWLL